MLLLFGWYWYQCWKKLVLEKVPVPEKIGPGKSTGTGKNWSRKKVPVPEKSTGPGKKYRSRYRTKFWVPSHSALEVEMDL